MRKISSSCFKKNNFFFWSLFCERFTCLSSALFSLAFSVHRGKKRVIFMAYRKYSKCYGIYVYEYSQNQSPLTTHGYNKKKNSPQVAPFIFRAKWVWGGWERRKEESREKERRVRRKEEKKERERERKRESKRERERKEKHFLKYTWRRRNKKSIVVMKNGGNLLCKMRKKKNGKKEEEILRKMGISLGIKETKNIFV